MDLASKKCVPCEGGVEPFDGRKAEEYLKLVESWELLEDSKLKITKTFKFPKYLDSVNFAVSIAKIAESENHHPDILIGWRKVVVTLTTHVIGGLSENDFILAAKIDKMQQEHERGEAK